MHRLWFTILLLGSSLPRVLAATPDGEVPGFFRAWLAAQQRAGDVRVDFSLTKTLPALKEPVKSSGRFWNYADGRFLWETGKPPSSVLRFNGTTLESWEAADNKWRKLDPTDRRLRLWLNFLSGHNLTEESLLKDFQITAPATAKPLATMVLVPRSARERKELKQLELTFEPAAQRLVRVVVGQGDGGSQQMEFGQPRKMTATDQAAVPPADRN